MSAHTPTTKKSTNVRFDPARVMAAGALRLLGDWLPSVSTPLVGWLWSTPRRHARPEREVAILMRGRAERIPLGVHGLRAWTWGAGPTVLLVHGWEGRGSQLGAFVGPLVEAGFQVVAFDAPGHGDSGGDRASVFSFADAVDAAARRFGPIYGLVAHSMGAAASSYAMRSGLPVERAVFVAPADAGQALPRFARQVGLSEVARERLAEEMIRRYGLPVSSLAAADLGAQLTAELFVVHDRNDVWVPIEDGEAYATAAGAELLPTEGLGHHRVLRDPLVVAAAVEFLAVDGPVGGIVHKPWYDFELDTELPLVTEEELLEDLAFGRD